MPVLVAKPWLSYMEGKHYEHNVVQMNHQVQNQYIALLTILVKKGWKSFIARAEKATLPPSFVLLLPCFDNTLQNTLQIPLYMAFNEHITILPPVGKHLP